MDISERRVPVRENRRMKWLLLAGLSVALALAVAMRGGVDSSLWSWLEAILISMGLAASFANHERDRLLDALVCILSAIVLAQLVPLPEWLVRWVSPASVEIWRAAGSSRWMPIGVAPAATVEEGVRLVATMSVLLAARQLGSLWRDKIWIPVLPVVIVAWLESVLGLVQYSLARNGGEPLASSGTYVNRNHYAGLLEMAFLAALAVGVWLYRKGRTRHSSSGRAAIWASLWFAIATCILLGIVTSQSRMGFLSPLGGVSIAGLVALAAKRGQKAPRREWWRVGLTAAAFAACLIVVFVFLPTDELIGRFAGFVQTEDMTQDTRLRIWRDTGNLIAAYPVLGSGLGSYETALLRYKSAAPEHTVDYAHNDYLQVLAETGFVGFAAVCALIGYVFWRAGRVVRWERERRNWWIAVGLTASLAAMALHSFVDFNLYIPANALALAWLAGLAVSDGMEAR